VATQATKTATKTAEKVKSKKIHIPEFKAYEMVVSDVSVDSDKNRCLVMGLNAEGEKIILALPVYEPAQNECLKLSFSKSKDEKVLVVGAQKSRRGNTVTFSHLEHVVKSKPLMEKIDSYLEEKINEVMKKDDEDQEKKTTSQQKPLEGPGKVVIDSSSPGQEGMIRRILGVHEAIHTPSVKEVVMKNGDIEKSFLVRQMGKNPDGSFKGHLRTVILEAGDKSYLFLEQNADPHKTSWCAQAAREGAKITWVIRNPDNLWMGHVKDGNWTYNDGVEERLEQERTAIQRMKESQEAKREEKSPPPKSAEQLELEQIHQRISGAPSWEYELG
jgi:hypothetical protein